MSERFDIPKELLSQLYEKDRLTTFQIADKIGCCQATVWKRLSKFNIEPREPGVERVKITKKELENLYIKRKLSTWKIERKTGIPRGTIHRKLKEFKIPTRDLASANIIYPKKDFSGNIPEKGYLIGFAIGDLRVRKKYKNSKTICISCGTTIQEQVTLLKKLFRRYGRIWSKKTTSGKTNMDIFVNESFDFLLTKEVPEWALNNRKYFFSFLAGFIDAEGHIGIHKKMAKFSLGNYDHKLLFIIYHHLNKFGIKCNRPYSDKRKGKKNNEGYTYNQNYWQFTIYKKKYLFKFFNEISPYLKHGAKVKALKMAMKNINNRNKKFGY